MVFATWNDLVHLGIVEFVQGACDLSRDHRIQRGEGGGLAAGVGVLLAAIVAVTVALRWPVVGCRARRGDRVRCRRSSRGPDRPSAARSLAQMGGGTIAEIRIEGIAADRAGDGPLLPADPAGRSLGRRAGRRVAEGAVRDRALRRRQSDAGRAMRWSSGWSRTRSSTASPSRVTEARRQGPQRRDPAAAARRLHPHPGAERREAHPRSLSPARPLRRDRRAQGHPARRRTGSISSSRSTRASSPACAASISSATASSATASCAAVVRDQGKPLVSVSVDQRHLRSRSPDLRSRVAAQILSVRGLRRFPRGLGGGRADARPRRLHRHLHRRRGRALPVRQDRCQHQAEGSAARRGAAAADRPAPATGTMPRRSNIRSRC